MGGKADDVEKALYTWFTNARARDTPATTAILEKATQFAAGVEKPNFQVTTGWLCQWKARHGIKYKRAHGEKNNTDVESTEVWASFVFCDCCTTSDHGTSTTPMKRGFTIALSQIVPSPFLLTI